MLHLNKSISVISNSIFNKHKWNSFGVDLYAGVLHDNGMGEIARVLHKSLIDNDIPHTVTPFKSTLTFIEPNHYPINVILGGAESAISIVNHHQISEDEYTIGVWFWELEDYFPWTDAYNYVDEIWCFSQFCYDVFKKFDHRGIPIHKLAYAPETNIIDVCSPPTIYKKYGLDSNKFTFFYSFDYYGSIDRKNPYAVVDSFISAFGNRADVQLVIKSMFGEMFAFEEAPFIHYIKRYNNIKYIRGVVDKSEFLGLINASDCYVSLHRSEGLGIGMMEAMYLGKPVIVTSYGGSMEFTDSSCALLVDYNMIKTMTSQCLYNPVSLWADPIIGHASMHMLSLVNDKQYARMLGNKCKEHILNNFNQRVLNKQIVTRLNWIRRII